MTGATVTFDYKDIKRFKKTVETFGQTTANKAARTAAQKGSNVVGKAIRSAAPVGETGQLKHGFKKRKDQTKDKGKAVYHYSMSADMNGVFQKPIVNVGKYGGKNKSGYYPASVEYGFLTAKKSGGYKWTGGTRKVDGKHFIEKAVEDSRAESMSTMKRVFNEQIDKEWAKT